MGYFGSKKDYFTVYVNVYVKNLTKILTHSAKKLQSNKLQ